MKPWYGIVFLMALLAGCSGQHAVSMQGKNSPAWVKQRPTDPFYYVGIGYASKRTNPQDYQRVAKKNAVDDLSGEIKVTISTNSLLSQQQINKAYSQQFLSDTRMNTSETLEGFEVAGSWEDKENYWIYYRLNKSEYEARKRRQREEAISRAVDLLVRADEMNPQKNFVQAFQLRVHAAAVLQPYLNEALEATVQGKEVFLMNEVFARLQQQLLSLHLLASPEQVAAIAGRALPEPIGVRASFGDTGSVSATVAFLPLKIEGNESLKFRGKTQTETQSNGVAQFQLNSIQSRDQAQMLHILPDIERMLTGDSLLPTLRNLLMQLPTPQCNVQLSIQPIRIRMQSKERNLDAPVKYAILEPMLIRELTRMGCTFVQDSSKCDYTLVLDANTQDLGVMWGNMMRASVQMTLTLKDAKTEEAIWKDGVNDLVGYQITPEKAGIEAYQQLVKRIPQSMLPSLEGKLFYGE